MHPLGQLGGVIVNGSLGVFGSPILTGEGLWFADVKLFFDGNNGSLLLVLQSCRPGRNSLEHSSVEALMFAHTNT